MRPNELTWQRLSSLLSWKGWAGLGVIVAILLSIVGWWLSLDGDNGAGATNVEILLDQSDAMGEFLDGQPKIVLGEGAVEKALDDLIEPRYHLAFRVFGGPCDGEFDDKTGLLVEFGKDNNDKVRESLDDLKIGGETTLAAGIIAAIEDLRVEDGTKSIIVITAGGDACNPDLAPGTIRQAVLREGIIPTFWFVGIGVPDDQRRQLIEIAQATTPGGEVGQVSFVQDTKEAEVAIKRITIEDKPAELALTPPTPAPAATGTPSSGKVLKPTPTHPPTPITTPIPEPTPSPTATPPPTAIPASSWQEFPINLNDTVSDGVPGPGAGDIETPESRTSTPSLPDRDRWFTLTPRVPAFTGTI